MTREQILAKIRENESAIRAEGVLRLAIYGSRARGDERPDCDLDVLIDVDPKAAFPSSIFPVLPFSLRTPSE